jgi:hypothetical protein
MQHAGCRVRWLLLMSWIVLAACGAPNAATSVPSPASRPTLSPTATAVLTVSLLYPLADTQVEMGQSVKFIVQVTDVQGSPVPDGQVTIAVQDSSAK